MSVPFFGANIAKHHNVTLLSSLFFTSQTTAPARTPANCHPQ